MRPGPEAVVALRKARRRLARHVAWSTSGERAEALSRWRAAHNGDDEELMATVILLLERAAGGERLL